MKKHLLTLGASVLAITGLASCAGGGNEVAPKKRTLTDVKVGLICLHDNNSTYDKNFIDSVNNAVENAGLAEGQLVVKTNIPEEGNACLDAANDLYAQGCRVIIADSFGHEAKLKEAAQTHSDAEFIHCTGVSAATSGLANFHNAFASIYEGRYLAGVAAGLKLQEMQEENSSVASKVGYVGAYTYAEVISGYTSWYLGVKSIVPDVTMEVQFTGSWYDFTAEKEAANTLIQRGAVLLSQHADSMGAPQACEENHVPDVSYNGSTYASCPETFIVSSRIDWTYCFEQAILAKVDGTSLPADIVGTIIDGSVKLTDVGSTAAARTQAKLDKVRSELLSGETHVFDVDNFTVNGEVPSEANVRPGEATWGGLDPEATFLDGGYYHESELRSAPSFDVEIDGITLLNRKY